MHVSAASKQIQGCCFTFKAGAKEPPLNLYKPKEQYTATIVSVERVVGPKAPGETCHIVIDHDGNVPYWEGQSYEIKAAGSTFGNYFRVTTFEESHGGVGCIIDGCPRGFRWWICLVVFART
ncbi:hypothetical protein Q3G72_007713 [Acer saccharum]|nr:hypothetical protein Q3G72_007713 [Acer saccharum]